MRNKILLIALLFISACSFTREVGDEWVMTLPDSRPDQMLGATQGTTKAADASLKVELPESPSYLESQRVAVKRPDGALDYYAGARWADMLPLHLQQALVGSLRSENIYKQVVSDEVPTPTLYRLTSQINGFYVVHENGRPEAVLNLAYTLEKSLKPLHSGMATGRAALANESRGAIQDGYAEAYRNLTDDLAKQLRKHR